MMKKVIKCGKFFSAVDEKVMENIAITIEENRITAIGPVAAADCTGAEVIDLGDKFVMPGLIDAHTHVNMNGAPTVDTAGATVGELTINSILYAQKDLMAGFTSIRDEGAAGFSDVAVRDAINKGKIVGPRMLVSGVAVGTTGGHCDSHFAPGVVGGTFGNIIDGPDEGRRAARYTFKYGADQVKIMATGGVMSYGDEPGASELTYEEMKAILDVANSRGKLSSAHAHGAAGIKDAIRAGITSIEHGMLMDDECIDMMAEHGTYLIPTIIAAKLIVINGVASGIPDWAVAKAERCLENHHQNLLKCIKKGVKVGFGTDVGTPYNRHGEQGYEFELMVDFGFTPAQALQAATKVNATMMKWGDKVGTLEVGKLADVVAFAKSPLEDIKVMKDCAFVMKDGVVYKN